MEGCAISPDGKFVATGSDDFTLCITDISTREKVYTVQYGGEHVRAWMSALVLILAFKVYGVAWSPDGTRLVAVTGYIGVNGGGTVIEVTNNNAHSAVYENKHEVSISGPFLRCSLRV